MSIQRKFQSTRLSRASTTINSIYTTLVHISIHKALASLDLISSTVYKEHPDFNPQGSREPRLGVNDKGDIVVCISIHKALASLDSKIIQTYSTSPLTFYALCSSLPSSTNSVHSPSPLSRPFPLFFRCESPWHFRSAWHSHLV